MTEPEEPEPFPGGCEPVTRSMESDQRGGAKAAFCRPSDVKCKSLG